MVEAIAKTLSGMKAKPRHVLHALRNSELVDIPFSQWSLDEIIRFASKLLPLVRPTLIIANKMDLLTSEKNLEMLIENFGRRLVAACSAEAELALRKAEKMGLLRYTPGQEKFTITNNAKLTPKQQKALEYIERRVLAKWMRTGIQQALNTVVFTLLKTNMVYTVSDESKFTDHHGNVLPAAYLMPDGSTPYDLARNVHTRLAENFIHAIDAETGIRLPKDYILRHKDIVKIRTQPRTKRHR